MANKAQFLIGTSGWEYPDWQDIFYPPNLPKNKRLEYYASQFDTVEVNATFYRFFSESTYEKWFNRVPENFCYVIKAPSLITHKKYLNHCEKIIQDFSQTASTLKEKLGLILLQLSPTMPYDLKRLETALCSFENPEKLAVEFRHSKWLTTETRKLLEKLGCVFCTADSPLTDLSDWVTSSIGYIRLHGKKDWYQDNYSQKALEKIADTARRMERQGAKKIYIFFNNTAQGFAIKNALKLKTLLD